MTVSEAEVISSLPRFTFFESVQTEAEKDAGTNTDADLLYNDFEDYYNDALDQLADALAEAGGLVLTDTKTKKALCYLIADTFLQKHPGWSASSMSMAPGESISRTDPLNTDPRKSFNNLIEKALAASDKMRGGLCAPSDDEGVIQHDDDSDYQAVIEGTYDPTAE